MIEYAGFHMPVSYAGITEEHIAVRTNMGIFDVSHMGEVEVKGKGATDFLQNLVANDVRVLEDNQTLYTHMCYPDGGTVDDLLVYKYTNDDYLLNNKGDHSSQDHGNRDNNYRIDMDIWRYRCSQYVPQESSHYKNSGIVSHDK